MSDAMPNLQRPVALQLNNILELTHYLKTKKRDSPTRVLDSNETNHQRLASILERLQR